jgi:NitT/TauT family transport system permease protein
VGGFFVSTSPKPATASLARLPNAFDIAAIILVSAALIALAHEARHTFAPLAPANADSIHLDPSYLPSYALRTVMRMFAALAASLFFTFTYATLAAKSRRAGAILIPILDILQSLPIFGFLTFTVTFFLDLFPGRVIGAELAVIFVIFTSQAWNMAFSMFQSLTTVPADLEEAARGFRLSPWQRFWRLDVPFAMPGLIWNMMMSMSGGWFMLTASEAVTVGNTSFKLPGIGSYIATALDARDYHAILYAIAAMLIVILAYDQLLFRPLIAWSGKFRVETQQEEESEDPWVLALLRRTRLLRWMGDQFSRAFFAVSGMRFFQRRLLPTQIVAPPTRVTNAAMVSLLIGVTGFAAYKIFSFCAANLTLGDAGTALLLGVYTLTRVVTLMLIATAIWVPLGVVIGLSTRWSQRVGAAAQFLAAFPANLFYPIFVAMIVRYHLNPDFWLTPLIILGTQWYILFNVIAGAHAFPGDLREVARNFRVGGLLWWRRVILPGIFPYFVTGAITAWGGSWNASLVAEIATWGHTTLKAQGLGAYIQQATNDGDSARVLLGMVIMAGFVLTTNRLVWRPMYAYASRRLTL